MSFAEEFQAAERKALVENTAQDVFNNLKDLVNHASLHASRWIWELLQNARDAAIPGSPLHIHVCLTESEVSFQHDGMAFNTDQVAHLIHHGSTKSQEDGQVGRFGTGFLSTHIISKVPRVSGRLTDGRDFSFVLDRTGTTPKELTDSMDRSSKEFVASVVRSSGAPAAHSTRYVYPVSADAKEIAQQGVASLESYAPYVLAFNPEIESIEIVKDAARRQYQRHASKPLRDNGSAAHNGIVKATPVEVKCTGPQIPPFVVATAIDESITVAVVAQVKGDGIELLYGPHVPRFFMAFPLFGTEGMGFPGVINSLSFRPQKDRDGLYLGPEQTDDNAANKVLIEKACPLFVSLLEQCASAKWAGIDLLCNLTATAPRGVDDKWLYALVKNSLVEPIRAKHLLSTCNGGLIPACDAWIPLASPNVPSSSLWSLLHDFVDSDSKLVNQSTAASWEANLRGWSSVLGLSPEKILGSYTLEDCADNLSAFGSLDRLREELRDSCDPVAWCNKLFRLLIQAGQTTLFDSLSVLPDQNRVFQKRNALRLDREIAEGLKDIGEVLGLRIRAGLLHNAVAVSEIQNLFQPKCQNDVLDEIIAHLQAEAGKVKPVDAFRQANVRLFVWILKHGVPDNLESFPALTQECVSEGESQHVILLTDDGEPEAVPLAPPECWPEEAREFAALFPVRHVLSSEYHAACPESAAWAKIADRGFVSLMPIFEMADYVEEFLPDDTLSDDKAHKSIEPVSTKEIAFLTKKDVGLIDIARKSKAKCLLFLRFLAAYMIRSDSSWRERLAVKCECGSQHECLKAGWVVPLKVPLKPGQRRQWIYLDKNRSEYLSVESLTRILKDEKEIVGFLAEEPGPAFLAVLGVSAGDFLMRSATPNEDSQAALSRSAIQMFLAVGGDIGQMNDLAQEITAHPETIKEIRERVAVRRKVKRNQDVGKAVEEALRSALGDGHGLTVERDPVGSDYSIEPEFDYLDDAGQEVLLRIDKFFIEIKATVGQYVRMTEVQGKKARDNSNRYALCVVVLSDQDDEINGATIREKAKFVTDIGNTIRPLVEGVESLEGSQKGVLKSSGAIEIEMQDQAVKFKIGHQVWETGIGFDDAVRYFGGSTESSTVRPLLSLKTEDEDDAAG